MESRKKHGGERHVCVALGSGNIIYVHAYSIEKFKQKASTIISYQAVDSATKKDSSMCHAVTR